MSASRLQLAGSINGFGPPFFSFAYFSCMLYWAGWSPTCTSHGSVRTSLNERFISSTMAGVSGSQAAAECHVVAFSAFLHGRCPRRAAARVAWRLFCDERPPTESHRLL